jgi:hypothetical protein
LNNDIFYLFYDEYDHKHFQNFVNVLSSYEIRRKNLDEIDQIFVIVRSSFFLTIKKKKILPPNVDFHTEWYLNGSENCWLYAHHKYSCNSTRVKKYKKKKKWEGQMRICAHIYIHTRIPVGWDFLFPHFFLLSSVSVLKKNAISSK